MESTINKQHLHALILQKLDDDLAALVKAAEAAYDGAVHEEAVSKSKYETHGLELSYLAGSHFERSIKLRRQIEAFRSQPIRTFASDAPLEVGALITLREAEVCEYIYLCHVGAGLMISLDDKSVQIVTPLSPLGQQLLELSVGDEIEIKTKSGVKTKLIVSIC